MRRQWPTRLALLICFGLGFAIVFSYGLRQAQPPGSQAPVQAPSGTPDVPSQLAQATGDQASVKMSGGAPFQASRDLCSCGDLHMLWLTDPRTIGEQVVDLQEGLAMAGYFESQIDGVFGPATDAAVRRFQAAQGMKVNGIVDLAVWMALGRVCEDIAVRLSEPLTDLMSTPAVHSGPQQGGPTAASPKASPDASPDASLTRTGWRAILVDTSDLTLTVLEDGRPIHQFRVGVGAPSTPTPLGQYRIIGKAAWAGGFGSRWMGLNVPWGKFGIHGTNKPWTVGRRKSSGCVRMFNRDVEKLYALVDVGTPVVIIGGMLRYLGSRRQTIRPGVKAGHVIEVQKCLIELGYISGPPDGVYGPGTEKAIMRLQKDRGLPVTGIVDGPTYDALGLYAFE